MTTRSIHQAPKAKINSTNGVVLQRKNAWGKASDLHGDRIECNQTPRGRLQCFGYETPTVTDAPASVYSVLRSSGQPLDSVTLAFMEPRFGQDLSHVRVHTDSRAAESAQALCAHAYTVDQNVVFAPGRYAPSTTEGKQLLAHELTHVVQQRAVNVDGPLEVRSDNDNFGREADVAANQIAGDALGGFEPQRAINITGFSLGRASVQRRVVCPPGVDPEEGTGCYETADDQEAAFSSSIESSTLASELSDSTPNYTPAYSDEVPNKCDANTTPREVSLCHRDFAGKIVGALVPARHCFVWYHSGGSNMTPARIPSTDTSTFDPSTSGTPDAEPNKPGTLCLQTYDVDPDCVKAKYIEKCSPSAFDLSSFNCCSCAYTALTECGAHPQPSDFPSTNQGTGLPDSHGTGWKKTFLKGFNQYLEDLGRAGEYGFYPFP